MNYDPSFFNVEDEFYSQTISSLPQIAVAPEYHFYPWSPTNTAPTIRETLIAKYTRGCKRRRTETPKTRAAPRETIPISDNSRRLGGAGAEPVSLNSGLRQAFVHLIPTKPYCADNFSDGLSIRGRAAALKKRHVQLNGPAAFTWMIHDIDHSGAYYAHHDGNVPEPNLIMVNPRNGHAHSAYLMTSPVACHDCARVEPLRFYAAVERGIARRIEADRHYAGLITKNPLHRDWRVEWRRDEPYSLSELADYLFEADTRPDSTPRATCGAGRNVTVFDELRDVAYREVREFKRRGDTFDDWHDRCAKIALALNLQFPQALPISEVRAIAKSVAKWTWKHFSVEKFIARQTHLSKLANAKRWAGHLAESTTKPWQALGISRATYYRKKKSSELGPSSEAVAASVTTTESEER